MKKIRAIVFSIVMLLVAPGADAQNLATTIKVQAMDMGNAVIRNDFNTFVKYMHPAIIEFAGGKEKIRAKMDSAYQMMKQFNVSFKRYWIGSPGEIVKHKNSLQAVLPEGTVVKTPFGELTAETHMVVVSNDNGKNWWSIDTNVYGAEKLKNILPELSPKLVIPPGKKPTLVPVENNR